MKRQFTGTVFIIQSQKVLLIFHRKLQKWLPPGGHLEPNELPSEGAIREAFEETGIEVELIPQENLWIEETWNSKSFERPYMCLIENIPDSPNEPAHQHIDFIYVGRPIGGKEIWNANETEHLRWFSWKEIERLKIDEEIFRDTKAAIQHLLQERFLEVDDVPMKTEAIPVSLAQPILQ